MEEINLSSEPLDSSNWEVYKDALEPQPSRRRVKAWERAPVAAHAPRLQGQKIWKRFNTRPERNKENNNVAQVELELEKEGKGARKKMRMAGDKENITNAPWASSKSSLEIKSREENPYESPKKRDAIDEQNALLVPRKRTNANHLITPRKYAQNGPLNTETVKESLLQGSPKLQGPRASLTLEVAGELRATGEKPARRRKSMRRSIRRSMAGDTATPVPDTAAPSRENMAALVAESSQVVEVSAEVQLGGTTNEAESEEKPGISPMHSATFETAEEIQKTVKTYESREKALVTPTKTSLLENVSSPVEEKVKDDISANEQEQKESSSLEELLPTAYAEIAMSSEETTSSTVTLQPEVQQPILESIEENTKIVFCSPAKSTRTPKKRGGNSPKKGRMTPQPISTRRSSRVTSRNSIQLEVLPPAIDLKPTETISDQLDQVESSKEPITHDEVVSEPSVPFIEALILEQPSASERSGANSTVSEKIPIVAASLEEESSSIQEEVDQQLTGEIDATSSNSSESISANFNISAEENEENIAETALLETSLPAEMDERFYSPSPERSSPSPSLELVTSAEFDVSLPVNSSNSEGQVLESISEVDEGSETSDETLEALEPITVSFPDPAVVDDNVDELSDDFQGTSTPDPTTTELVETISKNASPAKEDLSDTEDMLRNFLTRVKANKAAKAVTSIPKRKRSLPHSPIQVPLGTEEHLSPTSPKPKDEFDVILPTSSSAKRRKPNPTPDDEDGTESKSNRRSGRTRLPVKASPVPAPSFIPVRRLGQDGDNTITLRRNEEKELAALTRVNTRKNKGGAVHPQVLLKKKEDEKEDPAARQRALKEVFDEKAKKQGKKGKSVVWAEELVHFQTQGTEGKKVVIEEPEKENVKVKETEKEKKTEEKEKKTAAVRVGMRSKMSLGMATNGTPAPKRKMRGRS